MQQMIVEVGITRRITKIFEARVNTLLSQGYRVVEFDVQKSFFKILCVAVLEKPA